MCARENCEHTISYLARTHKHIKSHAYTGQIACKLISELICSDDVFYALYL